MHTDPMRHPDREQLAAYGLGKLDDADIPAVVEHVEACETCQRVVEETPSDRFLRALHAARPEPELPPELTHHPKFQVIRELGRGGMGVVYLAEHRLLGRPVAIKVIRRALVENPDAVERFRREARAAAAFDHPNIVRAYDAERAGELHLLVMEYVEGLTLAQVLEHDGALPVPQACRCARQAALALQHAFEKGMVHRDLKPHNLMLVPGQGAVKVLDFGLAGLASEQPRGKGLTAENAVMGTPEYIAPEQATDARQADIRADIYSLGCTLYCLLTGRPPFVEPTAMRTILAHLDREPVPLRRVCPDMPATLSAVVARMMAKEPADRYQTPGEVAAELAPYCESGKYLAVALTSPKPEGPQITPAGAIGGKRERVRPDAARLPRRVAGLVAALAVLGLVAGIFLLLPRLTDKTITNSLGMRLVLIPAGNFVMGSADTEPGREAQEGPRHRVRITGPFYMGEYEVTQSEYEKVMGENPSNNPGARNPVEGVLWAEAAEFCRRLSGLPEEKQAKRRYRLPTEAEWEYACRAGAATAFAFGDSLSTEQANFNAVAEPDGAVLKPPGPVGRTAKVGSYKPNAWGLYDMHGNVFEWVSDAHDDAYYANSPQQDPNGPANPTGFRVLRGGSWWTGVNCCRSAFRKRGGGAGERADDPLFRDQTVGFRVVCITE